MSNFLSKLFDLLKAIIKKIVDAVVKFVKKYWVLILMVMVVWFAPAIGPWLNSVGAPSFLVNSLSWVSSTLTIPLKSGLAGLVSGSSSLGSTAWSAYAKLGIGAQTAIAVGAAAAIAPEETAAVLEEAVELVADITSTVLGAGLSAIGGIVSSSGLGTVFLWGGLAFGAYLLLKDGKDENKPQIQTQIN